MTLQELHDETKRLLSEGVDPNLEVWHQGCDCMGHAKEIEVWADRAAGPCVYITRDN